MSTHQPHQRHPWQPALLFSAAFYACAKIGMLLSVPDHSFVSFWLPAGLYVGALLLQETRSWPWFILAALPANLLFDLPGGASLATALGFYSANTAEAVASAWLVRRFVGEKPELSTLKDFFGLMVGAALLGALPGATIGAATMSAAGLSHSFWGSWRTWWGGNAMAILLVTPFLLTWRSKPEPEESLFNQPGRVVEAVLLTAALIGFTAYMLVLDQGINAPYKSRLMPLLLWAGLRFGMRGATAANLLLALAMAFFTTHFTKGLSPAQIASGEYVATLQSFLVVSVLLVLVPTIVISERNRKVVELRESEGRFRQLTQAAFEGIGISAEGRVIDINDQILKMFGYERDEMIGRPITELVAPESRAMVAEAMRTAREGVYEHQALRKDGTMFHAEVQAKMARIGSRALRMTAVRDLTERRKAEEQRKKMEEQLRQAQKMEALAALAGGTAHEFNNMLGIIIGYSQLAKEELAGAHPVQANLDEILRASLRAKEITRQILAFSRQQREDREIIQLGRAASAAVKHVRNAVPATVEIQARLPEHGPVILGNPTQIEQVILNLCLNAWHAMDEKGGLIRLTQETVTLDQQAAEIHPALREGVYERLSISETGKGMNAGTLARIFEPFFTTKPLGKGSGLGLAVVHGIMQAHEGAVVAASEPGRGATFDLYFPARSETGVDPAPAPSGAIPRGAGQHILVVDDEPSLVRVATAFLQRLGYRTTGVKSAAEALYILRRHRGHFDLVITDLTMPIMNGMRLAKDLHALRPSLPVILVSGFDGEQAAEADRAPNIRCVLQKPFVIETLARTITDVFAGQPTPEAPPGKTA